MVNFLSGVGKVLTQVGVYFQAELFQFGVEHLADQCAATAAACGRFGTGFQVAQGMGSFRYSRAEITLGDIVTGTDLRTFRQGIHAKTGSGGAIQ